MPTRVDTPGIPAVPYLGAISHLMVSAASKASRKPKSGRKGPSTRAGSRQGKTVARQPAGTLPRKWMGIMLVAVCAISVLVGVLGFDDLPSLIGDNAEFMILARSVAAGNGLRYMHHPDNRAATKYPLGFPALLAGWISLLGDSVVSMKICVLVCYVAAIGITLLLASRLIGWPYAVPASLLVALSAAVVTYSNQVLSDVPYMLFSLLGIYLIMFGRGQRWHLLAGIAVCIWAFVVRSAGMSLVLAVVVFLFLKGKKKHALATLGAAALIGILWSVRNYTLTGEGSRYMQVLLSADPYDPDKGMLTFSGLVGRVLTNGGGYLGGLLPLSVLPTLVRPGPGGSGGALRILVSLLTVAVVLIGAYRLRGKGLLTSLYMLLYFGIYLVWPEVWKSERFMVPIAPLVAIYLVWGLRSILAYFDIRRTAIVAVCGVLAATNLFSLSTYIGRERGYPPGWANYLETARWAGANTEPASVVMCRKPFLFHLFSNRKTISYPFTRDRSAMREYLFEARPGYIVLDNFGGGTSATEVYVVPVLQEMIEYLSLAYETGEPVNKLVRLTLPEGPGND